MTLCLIDTSIFCEILAVPNLSGSSDLVLSEMEDKAQSKERLLLPIGTILETGNHVGQNGDGRQRRDTAERFVRLVEQAVRGDSPFIPTPFFEPQSLRQWLAEFPRWAGYGKELGDLTIVKEFERQCSLNPHRRVYVWSEDGHVSSYSREP